MNKKLLLSFILFFTFLINYGQCNFGGSLFSTRQSICYNREVTPGTENIGGVTFTNVPLGNYVAVNVIQGLTYTISATTNRSFVKRITLFNSANTTLNIGTAVGVDNNSPATLTDWVAPFTGVLYIRYINNGSCSDVSNAPSNISVTFTGGTNKFDSPLAQGTDTWIGHVYDFSNASSIPMPPSDTDAFSNYLGYFSQPNTVSGTTTSFAQNFGGDDVCFPFTAAGTSQTLRTDTFAVRYRMRSTLTAGCYFVRVTGDDGVRLFVDGVKVFEAWTQQSSSNYENVLVYLTGNSDLVFEYYEKNGANVSNFTIVPVNASTNTITPATRTICGGLTGALDGSNYPYNGSTVNPTIRFQWQSSPSASGPWTDATTGTGFNAEDYTPAALTPSVVNTTYYRRRVSPASNSLCYTDSAPVSITTNPKAVIPDMAASACTGSTFNVTPQDGIDGVVPATTIYTWPSPTGGSVTGRAASTGSPTSISGTLTTTSTTPQVVTYTVTATKGSCISTFRLLVTVYPTTIAGTVTGNSSVCAGTNSTIFTLSGNRGNVIRWESSTDNFTSVITPISNTTTTLTATDVTATTDYRAVVQNGSCATANSSVGTVVIKNPVATGVVICQGSPAGSLTATASCAAVAQTPLVASGTGGTSNTTSYTGTGNKGITINFPALPAGAVVTSTNVKISFQSFSPSWISELFIRVTPPTAMGPIQNDINPFPNSSANNRALSVSDIPIGTWGTGNPAGNWIFDFRESVYDGVNPDARITDVTITVNYTLPGTLDWFTTPSGGTKIGSGSSFNPVGVLNSGLADTNTFGTTPYYVACSADPACRTMVNYVINPAPVPVIGVILQPNCKISTGSIALSGLPLSGVLTRYPGAVTVPYSGTEVTDSNLGMGTYSYTTGNGTCTSVATAGIPINAPPVVATYNLGSWSSPPTIEKKLVFAGNFSSPGDVDGCACEVNSGVDVVINEGHTLTIVNEVRVLGGKLSFKNNSSLKQINNDPTINSGDISYERISTPIFQKDYIYWSSPVKNQKLGDLSPGTDPQKFFFNDGTNWVFIDRSNNMDIGKGYIIRGPLSYNNSTKQTFPAIFKGVPNNGSLEGELLSKGKYHLIGNPYPSALNADALISQNSTLLNGTIYFWTHNTPINSSLSQDYQYTTDDYATYNLSGGVSAKSDINHNNPVGVDNGIKPTGKIAAGQSFFVSTRTAGKVQFNNTMRVGGNNNQFFKSGNTEKEVVLEKNRIWLNMTNDKGAFKQLLVGYIEGATNFYENRYDGITFDGNTYLDFYSVNNGNKFVIQGRALPFDDSDIVPLGYRAAMEGAFTISIDEVDGKMKNQAIYIEDKVTGKIHDLRNSNYTFKTAIGTFTDRLILRYTDKTLGTGDFENIEDGILISVKNKTINVLSSKENIKDVTIFDITGKTLYTKNKVSNTELQIQNLPSSNQVLLVKVTLDNDFTTTRKIIFQ
ncbi:T9SS sorting signal type C domain-containing protein [Flavobacterium bizetiae]|uniref:T9SS sorting signal type C domain-containing protein n=1 Tax=Flavobacterium bizetiae TaxID=2704140 RepID=UPI003757BA92